MRLRVGVDALATRSRWRLLKKDSTNELSRLLPSWFMCTTRPHSRRTSAWRTINPSRLAVPRRSNPHACPTPHRSRSATHLDASAPTTTTSVPPPIPSLYIRPLPIECASRLAHACKATRTDCEWIPPAEPPLARPDNPGRRFCGHLHLELFRITPAVHNRLQSQNALSGVYKTPKHQW